MAKDITGEELYRLYEEKSAEEGLVVDPWEDLEDLDRRIWMLMAIEISFGD